MRQKYTLRGTAETNGMLWSVPEKAVSLRISRGMSLFEQMTLKFLTLLAVVASATAIIMQYDKYKVFRINPLYEEQNIILTSLEVARVYYTFQNKTTFPSLLKYSFWKSPSHNHPSDLMVAPEKLNEFFHTMNVTGIRYENYIDNVETLIRNENLSSKTNSSFDWTSYYTLEEVYQWLDILERSHPNVVKVIIGGHSYEDRDIKGIKLSFSRNNPGIFIEGGIHAREWISPATVTYSINEFLTSKEPSVRKLAESHGWYIFPTHCGVNRSKNADGCYGADGNRNWNNMWMIGASKNGCENVYAGSAAFSEIEMKSIFHCYSQLLLLPYRHIKEHVDNYDVMPLRKDTVRSILWERFTKHFVSKFNSTADNQACMNNPGSGISIDWVKNSLKLPVVFLFELRDKGNDPIIPNSQEILDGLLVLFNEENKHGYQ
ncbi:hypothetical protein TSAR_009733 [Trichomalopsis sarcophagae]|uniref:Peptidase M14 domain-containing protein n=1 Tax=Trichomalopsis sarcophagae TaxID=543379 RepID=A0A232F6H3_9HYME|nr:hypothetical protein TSAR_009733 [Trichomalopsis sarcophagae]